MSDSYIKLLETTKENLLLSYKKQVEFFANTDETKIILATFDPKKRKQEVEICITLNIATMPHLTSETNSKAVLFTAEGHEGHITGHLDFGWPWGLKTVKLCPNPECCRPLFLGQLLTDLHVEKCMKGKGSEGHAKGS